MGAELPEGYADFSRFTGETSAISDHPEHVLAGFVETNPGLRDDDRFGDLLVFGEGSLLLYARRVSTGEFQVLDRVTLDPVDTVPSFDAPISAALRRCLL